jgi:hypothetical protein
LLVDPGILVADIGHLKQIFIKAAVLQGLLEERLVRAGRAGGDNDSV